MNPETRTGSAPTSVGGPWAARVDARTGKGWSSPPATDPCVPRVADRWAPAHGDLRSVGLPRRASCHRLGGYGRHRVVFADQATAVAAGYRPCAVCLPRAHGRWRERSARPLR